MTSGIIVPNDAGSGSTASWRRPRRVPVVLLLAAYLVAMMGRYTLDRLGFGQYATLDLRLFIVPLLVLGVLFWRFQPDTLPQRHPWTPPILWAIGLFGYLALTAFWAPHLAQVGERLIDVVALGTLVVVIVSVSAPDPLKACRLVLVAMFASGMLYAWAGLIIGETDAQGRTVAFGGGPNVYVRVVLLGILASVALAVVYRKVALLLPIPVLAGAALLAGSRGGLLAAAATIVVFLLFFWHRLTWRAFVGALAVVGAGIVAIPTLTPKASTAVLEERFAVNELIQQDDYSGRPDLFGQALEVFYSRPLIGGGLDAFYAHFGISQDLGYPHNLILEVAATGGLVGLALLVGFTVSLVRTARSQSKLPAERVALLMAAVFIAAASMASGDFYDTRFLWIFAALAINRPVLPPSTTEQATANR